MTSHGLETNVLSDIVLPVALAVIMFGMGMSLRTDDFRRVAKRPKAIAAGLYGQLLVLPVLAMLVAAVFYTFFGASQAVVLGILILAASPGGATSNMVAFLARADAALSVSLTSVISLGAAVLTPAVFLGASWMLFGSAVSIQVSFLQMAVLVVGIVAIPIFLGMVLRAKRPDWAQRADRPFRIASIVFLFLVVAGVIAANRASFWSLAARSVPAALVLNALALAAGYGVGRLSKLTEAESRTLAIEVGFQNGTLGIALAVTQLNSAEAAIVPGFYGLVMFLTGGAVAWHWARPPAEDAPAPPAAAAERAS